MTQKMFSLFGTCFLLTTLCVLRLLSLLATVSQTSLSPALQEEIVGFLLLPENYFIEFDLIQACIIKSIVF